MNIDPASLVEAFGAPVALVIIVGLILLKYPPRPPVTPEARDAKLLAQLERIESAVTTLSGSVDRLSEVQTAQKRLAGEVQDLALKIAELNGRLSR